MLTILPSAFSVGELPQRSHFALSPRLALKAGDVDTIAPSQELGPIPLRDASAQSSVDSHFLEQINGTSTLQEILQLTAAHREELRLAESTMIFQHLRRFTSQEDLEKLVTTEEILSEVLQFQVDALKTLPLRPEMVVTLACLGQELKDAGELLTTALQVLKPKRMRMSELRAVLTSSLVGIGELRRQTLEAMGEMVHRMSPDVMVLALETLGEYQEQQPELVDEIMARAQEKTFRFNPHQGLSLLYALARLGKSNKALLRHFCNFFAVDISPYSLEELCHWAEVTRRLRFRDPKLLSILAKVSIWRAESMSASQLETMLNCFDHFNLKSEDVQEVSRLHQLKQTSKS